MMIYHILKAQDWERVRSHSAYTPLSFRQDGFIHMCAQDQFEGVVNRYFLGQGELVALCAAPESLVAELRYENLDGGDELFPHLYGPLNLDAVRDVIYFYPELDPTTGYYSISDIKSRLID
jgi:uncharacterized protein (DUF952 family)